MDGAEIVRRPRWKWPALAEKIISLEVGDRLRQSGKTELRRLLKEMNFHFAHRSSSPIWPASQCGLCGVISRCGRTADIPAGWRAMGGSLARKIGGFPPRGAFSWMSLCCMNFQYPEFDRWCDQRPVAFWQRRVRRSPGSTSASSRPVLLAMLQARFERSLKR